jgi:hypothetical protein
MASFPVLHEKIREHHEPRMSATALAKYLVLRPDKQDEVLHDSRYAAQPIAGKYAEAFAVLRRYNCDPQRPKSALEAVKKALKLKETDPDLRPKARDEATRCREAIELFETRENALALRSMALSEAPRFAQLDIEGVKVSIQPAFIRRGIIPDLGPGIGAGILRLAKTPDPDDFKMPATRTKYGDMRREMARYMVALIQLLLEDQAADLDLGTPHRDLCFVTDLRLGETVGPASDHTARLRTIRSACGHIATLWDRLRPLPRVLKKRD